MLSYMLLVKGLEYLSNDQLGLANWGFATFAIVCAICFLVGLFTPIVSLAVIVGVVGLALSWFALPARSPFGQSLITINVLLSSFAMLLLGPGAFSVDAHLFGRREIIIPQTSKSAKS